MLRLAKQSGSICVLGSQTDFFHRNYKPIDYPAPDGKLSFDILTSVSRTGTNHAENQPCHLVVKDGDHARHTLENVQQFDGLLSRVCPAAVYEYQDVADAGGAEDAVGKKFVINSQNCIRESVWRCDGLSTDQVIDCKTCSIKAPKHDIEWTVPVSFFAPLSSFAQSSSITGRRRRTQVW